MTPIANLGLSGPPHRGREGKAELCSSALQSSGGDGQVNNSPAVQTPGTEGLGRGSETAHPGLSLRLTVPSD